MTTATFIVGAPGSTSLGKVYRDLSVSDATAFLYDLGKEYSFPAQDNPSNGDPINDLSYAEKQASFVGSDTVPVFSGGGLDFSDASDATQIIRTPSNILAGINAGKYWAALHYIKLPTWADFTAMANANNSIVGYMSGAAINVSGGLMELNLSYAGGTTARMAIRRGTANATFDTISIDATSEIAGNLAPFLGTVTQILVAYTDDGLVRVRLRNEASTYLRPPTAGAANAADISAKYASFGLRETNRPVGTAKNFSIYRAQLEDLTVDGAPDGNALDAWADADWTRNSARFS